MAMTTRPTVAWAGGSWSAPMSSDFDPMDANFQKQMLGSQQGHQSRLAGLQASTQLQTAQIGADASRYPHQLQQGRFNRVFPLLSGQLGQLGGGGYGGGFSASGGGGGGGNFGQGGPNVTVGGVLDSQSIQRQVNAARSANDQAAQTQMAGNSQQLAGRGFGSNSPLLMALNGQTQMANLGTNTANERDIRLNAAQMNAGHLLNSEQARASIYAQRQAEALQAQQQGVQLRGQTLGAQNALLAALAGLV